MMAATMVRERPILFSGPMVRAILGGSKTQTRRIRGLEFFNDAPNRFSFERWRPDFPDGRDRAVLVSVGDAPSVSFPVACPYGQPGDRLWVRETFALIDEGPRDDGEDASRRVYRANEADDYQWSRAPGFRWSPSIFMPRRHSRIALEITGVRVERVQDITEADAIAEGVAAFAGAYMAKDNPRELTPAEQYQYLWDSLNEARGYGWNVNPWVWALEFALVNA